MHHIAKETRQFIERNHKNINLPFIHFFPKNCCELCSILLCKVFLESNNENDIFLVEGYDRQNDDHHYWVKASGLNFDITADQFKNIHEPLYGQIDKSIFKKFNIVEKTSIQDVISNNEIYINNEFEINNLVKSILMGKS